ncbi:MAG: hypothetical protein ACSLFP_07355, partial [Acidimicrobiales bacterium]
MLRTRVLAGATMLALSTIAVVPGAGAGEPGQVTADPDPVEVGDTTTVSPAAPADLCLDARLSATGPGPEYSLYWEIELDPADPIVDSGEVAVEPDGDWAVPIDTTGFEVGTYSFFAECYGTFPIGSNSVGTAGDTFTVLEYQGTFEVIAAEVPVTLSLIHI